MTIIQVNKIIFMFELSSKPNVGIIVINIQDSIEKVFRSQE